MSIEELSNILAEMLDDDLNLLNNVCRMQTHPPHEALFRGALIDEIFTTNSTTSSLSELESRLISRVVTQHIKDKTLLDGLLHRVHVERLWQPIRTRAPNISNDLPFGVAVNAWSEMF
ncbi:hypothetical protein JOE56_001992 [Brevibacterium paucivorans]|uniref:Uncharacterized protein n=1 Tax=Brevibacterium paucivorans TaxID=170994 RepID=A0ABS2SPX9_9MICO|nr:hypothetical protein [Brevibacterium paucivorans]MBM7817298.1 hypothetical protein [Brevibacterium paucivorans]